MLVTLRALLLVNIVSLHLHFTFTQHLPAIACPSSFQYQRDDSGIFGVITFAQLEIGRAEIKTIFSQRGLSKSNYYGAIKPYPTEDTIIRNVLAGMPATFRVDFPDANNIPKVIHISVNNMKLCSDQKYPPPSSWLELSYTLLTFYTNVHGRTEYSSTFGDATADSFDPPNLFNLDQQPPQSFATDTSVPTVMFRPITQRIVPAGAWPGTSQNPVKSVPSNKFTPITQRLPFGSQTPATTLSSAVPSNKFMPISQQQWPGTSQTPTASFVPVVPTATAMAPARRRSISAVRAGTASSTVSQATRNPNCGKEGAVIRHLLLGGVELGRGQYPWLTAIYKKTTEGVTFICGGSLVSQRTIITAAHCFRGLTARQILVYLGKHDLQNFTEEGMETRDISRLIVHHEYSQNQPDADIAILHMQPLESYTQFINVVCLWSETVDITHIVNRPATVAGWGSDENGNDVSPLPKMTTVNIVTDDVCTRSSRSFAPLLTNRTFCAGNLDGSGPCMGDSGSGLMMFRNGNWVLRGVVSVGQGTQRQCDLYEYVIYCDIAKHIDWVQENL